MLADLPNLDAARQKLAASDAFHKACPHIVQGEAWRDLRSALAAVDILIAKRDAQQARAERAEALLRKADEALLVITAIVDDPSDYEAALRGVDDVARSAQRHGAVPLEEDPHV